MLKKSLLCMILIAAATPVFGQNWTAVVQPLDNTITGISFINADTGFITTDHGEFARTERCRRHLDGRPGRPRRLHRRHQLCQRAGRRRLR